jgi:hypothetical protein
MDTSEVTAGIERSLFEAIETTLNIARIRFDACKQYLCK